MNDSGISYYDTNLLDNPYCFFSTKDLERFDISTEQASGKIIRAQKGLLYVYRYTDPKTKVEHFWSLQPDALFGWPGPIDQDVIALVKQLALSNEGGIPSALQLPSWRQMCRLMGKKVAHTKHIKESVQRIAGTVIRTDRYFMKDDNGQPVQVQNNERDPDYIFTLWGYYRQGEELPDGEVGDRVTLWLNEPFLSSLKSFSLRPFDYSYFITLPPLAKRIYLIQGRKFFGLKQSPYTKEDYEQWCMQLPLVPQQYLSKAKERLNRSAHRALIETGFLEGVEWVGSQKSKPWEIRYYPGPKAREEKNKGQARLQQLKARQSTNQRSEDRMDAHVWRDLLSQELKDTNGQNAGFYFKLGRAVERGFIRDSEIWRAISMAKDKANRFEVTASVSACFTDELKRILKNRRTTLRAIFAEL